MLRPRSPPLRQGQLPLHNLLSKICDTILRRQVVYYIQAFHVSDVEARGETHWVESIKISKHAEPEELGSWAG